MRKRKLSVVLLLILVVVMTSVFVACNPTDTPTNTTPPDIPIDQPGVGPDINGGKAIDSRVAWNMLKNAAFAAGSQEKDSRYVNVDTSFVLGYGKDGNSSIFVLHIAVAMNAALQTSRAAKRDDQLVVELLQFGTAQISNVSDTAAVNAAVQGGEGKLLAGFYFYDGKLVADVRGIKNAADETGESIHVVYTDNLDMPSFVKKLDGALKQLDITDVLFNKLLGIDIGSLLKGLIGFDLINMTVEDILVNIIFGMSLSYVKDNGNGNQTILIPCDLSFLAGLLPFLQGLISEDIIGLVKKAVGLDLGKLGALVGMAIYVEADIQDGILNGVDTSVDINFNSNASQAVKDRYGEFRSEVGFDLGYISSSFAGVWIDRKSVV